ncbi:unnamed protein product [Paramecium sonneborni]|uniref:Uncharacterized protein n=1 Tax=Paramecium sonneborni TaxID=65129 RepID=A0A8S1P5B7_9CILI|nr:unnamed protein product [Paramecium sonneborni]
MKEKFRIQKCMLQEKNAQLENDLAREKEKIYQMENSIRSLDNDIHKLQFKQSLQQLYLWNQELPNNHKNQIELTENSQINSGFVSPYSNHFGY